MIEVLEILRLIEYGILESEPQIPLIKNQCQLINREVHQIAWLSTVIIM